MRKKILFIIPYIPYPLDSGGNQAFFNMVEYLRHKMAVSVLLYPETGRRMQDVESLKKIWDNVDFFIYTPKTKTVRLPKIKHPFYYKWLQKIHASVTRKMNRQQIWTDETGEVVDFGQNLTGYVEIAPEKEYFVQLLFPAARPGVCGVCFSGGSFRF